MTQYGRCWSCQRQYLKWGLGRFVNVPFYRPPKRVPNLLSLCLNGYSVPVTKQAHLISSNLTPNLGWQIVKQFKCQVGELSRWQIGNLTKHKVDKLSDWCNAKLAGCLNNEMSRWRIAKLGKHRVDEMTWHRLDWPFSIRNSRVKATAEGRVGVIVFGQNFAICNPFVTMK